MKCILFSEERDIFFVFTHVILEQFSTKNQNYFLFRIIYIYSYFCLSYIENQIQINTMCNQLIRQYFILCTHQNQNLLQMFVFQFWDFTIQMILSMIHSIIQFIDVVINWNNRFWSIIGYVAVVVGYPGFYCLLIATLDTAKELEITLGMLQKSIAINLTIRLEYELSTYIQNLCYIDFFQLFLHNFAVYLRIG